MLAKVDIQHVPYRGSAPATQDLLAGQIHMMFDNIPGTLDPVARRQGPPARRHLGQAHAGRAGDPGDRRDAARHRHRVVDHPDRPGEAAARGRDAPVGAVEEGAGERRPQGQVRRPRGDGVWHTPADTLAYRDSEEARLAPIIKASGARVD